MVNRTSFWPLTLQVALLAAANGLLFPVVVVAQGSGDRPAGGERGDRQDRGGRGSGRWGGERDRGRDRGPDSNNREGDRRPEPRPAAPAPAAAPAASSFGTVSESERIRKSASDTIKANDKDGDGILAGDELKELGMSRNADQDGDGKITHNELVIYRSPKTESASASPPGPRPTVTESKSSHSDAAPGKTLIVNTTRKSYRFKTTKERINSWKFSSKDTNSDGQVSMSEYSNSWSDRTASEFLRYDKDNDGMITVEEAK